jgi:hypothetical protein
MIARTYLLSGILLLGTAYLFGERVLTATTLTACWCGVPFFASAGASSAYLTVSEVFPMETRAKVSDTVVAFSVGAVLMIAAGVVEIFLGVRAERQGLKQIARPLSAAGAPASNDGSGQRRAQAAG